MKSPLGILLRGNVEQTRDRLLNAVKNKYTICVGDAVAQSLLDVGLIPDVIVADGRSMRQKTESLDSYLEKCNYHVIDVENPPATIALKALETLKEVLSSKESRVFLKVRGEEDLLALPAILYSPTGSTVLYGQPNEGVVMVEVNDRSRKKAFSLLKMFRRPSIG